MDTYPFIAGGAPVVEDVLTRQDPAPSPSAGRATLAPGGFPTRRWSGERRWKPPLAPFLRILIRCQRRQKGPVEKVAEITVNLG